MNKVEKPRVIPAEGPFLFWKSDDIIYAYLQAYATFHPAYKRLYIRKKNLRELKGQLAALMFDPLITREALNKKINRHIAYLQECGLLLTTTMNIGRNEEEVYTFPEYDLRSDFRYQILDAEQLKEMVTVYRPLVIKIYIYLLDRYEWKLSQGDSEYVFTKQELGKMLGFSETSKSWLEPVTQILEHLNDKGYLTIQKTIEMEVLDDGREVPVERRKVVAAKRSGGSKN